MLVLVRDKFFVEFYFHFFSVLFLFLFLFLILFFSLWQLWDIIDFYPWIKKDLLIRAIHFAEKHRNISTNDNEVNSTHVYHSTPSAIWKQLTACCNGHYSPVFNDSSIDHIILFLKKSVWPLLKVWLSAAWLINCNATCLRYQKRVLEFVVLLP